MHSSSMQGGMNSVISPDENTKPDDSKTLLFVPDTPFRVLIYSNNISRQL